MPEKRFMTKKDAITYIMEQTGIGRYAVDRKIDQLHYQGNIHIEDDPIDSRKKRITMEDVERVIQFLRGGEREG